jgi:hypothetical protein
MASNIITAVIPKLLAQGLLALRQNAITPRLVASMSSTIAGKKGSTIDVPVPSAITATDVTPAATAPVAGAMVPTTVPVVLNNWKEAAFDLSDNEYEQAMDGVIPMQASEAVKAIVQAVDLSIMALYVKFYGTFGTAGTTPFGNVDSGIADAVGIRKVLNNQLVPMEPRHVVLNPDAEANALAMKQFADMQFSGSVAAMQDGMLNRKLGMNWWMNQNVPTMTTTVFTAGAASVNGVNAAGILTLSVAKLTNTTPLVEGDILTIASGPAAGNYVVTAATTLIVGNTTVNIYPPLRGATAGAEVVTKLATGGVQNLAFHRDAIAFANRPLSSAPEGLGSISMAQMDPVSGLSLRLEVTREFKRTRWSFDFLWGVSVIRRELGARLLG